MDSIKLCECGCGEPAPIAKENNARWNCIKGMPKRFIHGHSGKFYSGNKGKDWKGGISIHTKGYILKTQPDHPRANFRGYVFLHILVVEKALGKHIPKTSDVHHLDGNVKNNSNSNLVLCENRKYHMLLHQRQRAKDACGKPNFLKCCYCGEYDDPGNMAVYRNGTHGRHQKCDREYQYKRYHRASILHPQ